MTRQEDTAPHWRLLSAGAWLLFAVQAWEYVNFSVDDVFITLRYAGNIARGLGPVYNAGEMVEGYSNWTWMQLLALTARIAGPGHDPYILLWAAKAGSLLFGVGTLLLTVRIARRMHGASERGMAGALALALTAASGPFAAWSMGGLETTLNAFLFALAAWLGLRIAAPDRLRPLPAGAALGTILAMAAMTRPEPALHAGVMIASLAFFAPSGRRLPAILGAAGLFIVLYGAFLGWRVGTYHDLLPNTFYAKTGGGLLSILYGVKYASASLALVSGAALLPLAAVFLRPIPARRPAAFLALPVLCSLAFSVYSGGDWMPGGRFLVPVLPLISVLGASGIVTLWGRLRAADGGSAPTPAALTGVLLTALMLTTAVQRDLIRGQLPGLVSGFKTVTGHAVASKERAGLWLRTRLPAHAVLASGEAGVIGWLNPGMPLIDCNGLMDRTFARDRRAGRPFDATRVFTRRPDAIVLLDAPVDLSLLRAAGSDYQQTLRSDPRFRRDYRSAARFADIQIFLRREADSRK